MKKHNAFVIQFLKRVGHAELIDTWCLPDNQEAFLKIKFDRDDKLKNPEKRKRSPYILFVMDRLNTLMKENPYLPTSRLFVMMGREWQEHKKVNSETYQQYRLLYAKRSFNQKHQLLLQDKYPYLSVDEIATLLEKMFEKYHEHQFK